MPDLLTLREAWDRALYGGDGFFLREAPAQHFRTSATASPMFASAIAELARRSNLEAVIDMGAGSGELLRHLAATAPQLRLHGVDVRSRPAALPARVGWSLEPPPRLSGLVIANELLDNVPCTVAEVGTDDVLRELVVTTSGDLFAGAPLTGGDLDWVGRWWPDGLPGQRIEVGRARDEAWSAVVDRLEHGVALAVDYGHVRGDRPAHGSLRSYRAGRRVDLVLDGTADVTADVALDSVAAAGRGRLLSQRSALHCLGVRVERPAPVLATRDPSGYLRALSAAGAAGELVGTSGFGDFGWVVTPVSVADPFPADP